MRTTAKTLLGLAAVAPLALAGAARAQDPCANPADCCVNAATCVITDKAALAAVTVDKVMTCRFTLGRYVTGGNGATGHAPAGFPANKCGLSFDNSADSPAAALAARDHLWLQSSNVPQVVDFGRPVKTAFVFESIDHGPIPEEGVEATVWGSASSDISAFPMGWTRATLTRIWKKGWEDPVECQGQDNSDDLMGQYAFSGPGFRFVAVHANGSITIFDDATHTSWSHANDDFATPGWQSSEDEIDAVGTPVCDPNILRADAGSPHNARVGEQICLDASASTSQDGISSFGWDLDGDGTIDATGPRACFVCQKPGSGQATVFVTSGCACVASASVRFTCR
jgi:hypothetical protein